MEITEVRIFLTYHDPLKAIVSITIDSCVVIRDLKIIRGSNGHFRGNANQTARGPAF